MYYDGVVGGASLTKNPPEQISVILIPYAGRMINSASIRSSYIVFSSRNSVQEFNRFY
jgi:hypothetical protein